MVLTTHRQRVLEKKLLKKLLLSITLVIVFGIFLIFAGLPLISRIILFISPSDSSSSQNQSADSSLLFPPSLDPQVEATNSSDIAISGYSEKEAQIRILLNGKEYTTTDTDADGKFYVKKVTLIEGENTIAALLIKDKKESTPSAAVHIVYKKEPPKLEVETPKDGETLHDNKELTVHGLTDPGNRITVNDRFSIVDSQGKFSYTLNLNEGENILKFIATDQAGNQTTKEIKVHYSP